MEDSIQITFNIVNSNVVTYQALPYQMVIEMELSTDDPDYTNALYRKAIDILSVHLNNHVLYVRDHPLNDKESVKPVKSQAYPFLNSKE